MKSAHPVIFTFVALLTLTSCSGKSSLLNMNIQGVSRYLSEAVSGSCSRDEDRAASEGLEDIEKGCDLTDKTEAIQRLYAKGKVQVRCVDNLISALSRIPSLSCRAFHKSDVKSSLLDNLFSQWDFVTRASEDTDYEQRLSAFLLHLSAWETRSRSGVYLAKQLIPPGTDLNPYYQDFATDLNKIHSMIAKDVLARGLQKNKAGSEKQDERFTEQEVLQFELDRQLLKQTNPGPISLLQFTSLSLASAFERAKTLAPYYDLLNSLTGAPVLSFAEYSEPIAVIELTSLLVDESADDAKIRLVLEKLKGATQVYSLFDQMIQNRAKLIAALRFGMSGNSPIASADISQFEPLAYPFIQIIQDARGMMASMNHQNRFHAVDREFLGPFTKDESKKVSEYITARTNELLQEEGNYSNNRKALIEDLIGQNQNNAQAASLESMIKSSGYELRMAELDRDGLQQKLQQEEVSLAKYLDSSFEAMSSDAYMKRYGGAANAAPIYAPSPIKISAQDALYLPGGAKQGIADIAVQPKGSSAQKLQFPVKVKAGDLISIQALSGNYNPTCAIAKAFPKVSLTDVVVGPEGFMLTSSNSVLHAESAAKSSGDRQSEMTTDSSTEYIKGCGSTSIGASIGASFLVSSSVSISETFPHDCTTHVNASTKATEISRTDNIEDSSELRQTASFERGVRTDFAPFSYLPAGALVAVEVDPKTQKMIDTRIVQRDLVFSASSDADLYLVVNDCADRAASSKSLDVRLTQSRPPTNLPAGALSKVLRTLSQTIAEETPSLLQTGEFTGTDQSSLRSKLDSQFANELAALSFTVADVPLLSDIYQAWTSAQIAQLERRVRIRQLNRKISLLYIRYRDLVDQSRRNAAESPLRTLAVDWALNNSAHSRLQDTLLKTVTFLEYRALPVLATVDPDMLPQASKTYSAFIDKLSLNTDLKSLSEAVRTLISDLNLVQATSDLKIDSVNQSLVVSFPRTTASSNGSLPSGYEERMTDEGQKIMVSKSVWSSVPYEEANRVWTDFIAKKRDIEFNIRPQDIYNPSLARATVTCKERAPFIKSMSVVLVFDEASSRKMLNLGDAKRPLLLPGSVEVPNTLGLERYLVSSDKSSSREITVPIRYGDQTEALEIGNAPDAAEKSAAQGFSPLGTFTLEGENSLHNDPSLTQGGIALADHVTEILFVFKYDSLNSSQRLSWIPTCAGDN